MAENRAYQYYVLWQKIHRGPFTEAEVRSLIERGVVRRSDLAMKLRPGEDRNAAGWQILGRFPEFDRRGPQAPAASPPAVERRSPISDEAVQQAIADLPKDLFEAALGALPPRSPIASAPEAPRTKALPSSEEADVSERSLVPRLSLALGIFLAIGMIFSWLGSSGTRTQVVETAKAPASLSAPRSTAGLPKARPAPQMAAIAPVAPPPAARKLDREPRFVTPAAIENAREDAAARARSAPESALDE